ncbi:MAG: T9SS type A sorting domain-containing protein [Crocinitomicaceae bacterium]|nr:T9SS type A sorting domain-containing protein [Crocinitomicaceae bacterium]MDG1775899.1 T9SS type A sorting domain-containing protein [Crocinitomicaceae bacterium]
MKNIVIASIIILSSFTSKATVHTIQVWNGYFQFLNADITIQLGDTVQWLPLDVPTMIHSVTSTNIPVGATAFDQIWQAPADTFFQYVPQVAGLYEYECTPHATSYGMVGSITVLEDVTGITDGIVESEFYIYPNPATEALYFSESNLGHQYTIFTSKGDRVLSGTTKQRVNISTLPVGVYHIELIGDKRRVLKFVKR